MYLVTTDGRVKENTGNVIQKLPTQGLVSNSTWFKSLVTLRRSCPTVFFSSFLSWSNKCSPPCDYLGVKHKMQMNNAFFGVCSTYVESDSKSLLFIQVKCCMLRA